MATKFSVISSAMNRLGVSPVQNFDTDDSEEAKFAANNYARVKRMVFSCRIWNFNQMIKSLAPEVVAPTNPNWTYSFLEPSDMIRMNGVMDDSGNTLTSQQEWMFESGRIFANIRPIFVRYRRDIDEADLNKYPHIEDLLIKALSKEAAKSMTGLDSYVRISMRDYEESLRNAASLDQESNAPYQFISTSPWLEAAWGSCW